MNFIVDYLNKKNLIYKSFERIPTKDLASRKKLDIFLGVDMKGYYNLVIHISKKSRFIKKDSFDIIELHRRVEILKDTSVVKKYILIEAPLCSKAKAELENLKWIVWNE